MISDNDYIRLKNYIYSKTGVRIQDTSEKSVKRFIDERLDHNQITIDEYFNLLDTDVNEQHRTINAITINETYFFREQKYFTLLEEVILPQISENHFGQTINLWSAASSIGAEALSLDLICNKYRKEKYFPDYKIYASDIDKIALDFIREGKYSTSLLKSDGAIFHSLIENNAEMNDDTIKFNDMIISKINTFHFNLVRNDYNSLNFRPHVVFLRNILTYMDLETKNEIINNIVSIMPQNSFLIVSSSDTAFISNPSLELLEYNNSFYFKKNNGPANE